MSGSKVISWYWKLTWYHSKVPKDSKIGIRWYDARLKHLFRRGGGEWVWGTVSVMLR